MKRDLTDAEYIAALEAKISSISEELSAVCKERDNLQEVILKMSDELRNLRRMMFGRKAERFIADAPRSYHYPLRVLKLLTRSARRRQ